MKGSAITMQHQELRDRNQPSLAAKCTGEHGVNAANSWSATGIRFRFLLALALENGVYAQDS